MTGPGTALLATITGRDAEEIAASPAVAVRALGDLAKELVRLAADSVSPDDAVREAAERRAAELRALATLTDPSHGGTTPCP